MNVESQKNTFKQEFKKRCFLFSLSIINLTNNLKGTATSSILAHQLIRSATSIGANVVEGGNSASKKEFVNYFQISLKSSSETLYWLALLKKLHKEQESMLDKQLKECIEIKKIISTIILNTKSKTF